jgi:hypothetical protein
VLKIFQVSLLHSVQGVRCDDRQKFLADQRIKHFSKSAALFLDIVQPWATWTPGSRSAVNAEHCGRNVATILSGNSFTLHNSELILLLKGQCRDEKFSVDGLGCFVLGLVSYLWGQAVPPMRCNENLTMGSSLRPTFPRPYPPSPSSCYSFPHLPQPCCCRGGGTRGTALALHTSFNFFMSLGFI